MWNTCWQCGLYRVDKAIDPAGPAAICPECGFRHPFLQLPLLLVSGASGSGKSAVCRALLGQVPEAVLLDSDILWRPEYDTPGNHYRDFFETWLRMAKNIGQSGRPVVLFGAGFGVPANLEPCVERRYFGKLTTWRSSVTARCWSSACCNGQPGGNHTPQSTWPSTGGSTGGSKPRRNS